LKVFIGEGSQPIVGKVVELLFLLNDFKIILIERTRMTSHAFVAAILVDKQSVAT